MRQSVFRVVSPVLAGNVDPEIAELLDEYSIYDLDEINTSEDEDEENDDDDNEDIDPRWAKLKDLKP